MNSTNLCTADALQIQTPRAVAWLSTAVVGWMRERVIASGGNGADIPDISPARFLRRPEVCLLTGLSCSSLYRMIASAEFPRPIAIDRAAACRAASAGRVA